MKVFIVTSGEYSDKGNEAVFSNYGNAKDFVKATNQYGNGYNNVNEYIEEFELDPDFNFRRFKFKNFYWVVMEKDGNVIRIDEQSINILHNSDPEHISFVIENSVKEPVLAGTINADTRQHAVKILNDKRRQIIAENKWIDDLQGKFFMEVPN